MLNSLCAYKRCLLLRVWHAARVFMCDVRCLLLQAKPQGPPALAPQVPNVRESPRKLFGRKSKLPAVAPMPPPAPIAEPGPKCVPLCQG